MEQRKDNLISKLDNLKSELWIINHRGRRDPLHNNKINAEGHLNIFYKSINVNYLLSVLCGYYFY